jgi:hypothetical protein
MTHSGSVHLAMTRTWWAAPDEVELLIVVEQVLVSVGLNHGIVRVEMPVYLRYMWHVLHSGYLMLVTPVFPVPPYTGVQI